MLASGSKRTLDDDDSDVEEPVAQAKASRADFDDSVDRPVYSCSLPPTCVASPKEFTTLTELDAHYRTWHQHICCEPKCGKIFPDDRFLHLHETELHDPLAEIRRERGEKIYACFETSCARKFSTPKTRRLHLIDLHKYPKEYYFRLPLSGMNDLYARFGSGVSLVGPGWKPRGDGSPASPKSGDDDPPSPKQTDDAAVDELAAGLEAARLVPTQIRFGRKTGGKLLGPGRG